MIIVDFSNVALATVFVFGEDFKIGRDPEKMEGILRHSFLSSLLAYKRDFGKKYGEMIIACDDRHYWRKDEFPQYKANRKKSREESDMDWDNIFKFLDQLKSELRNVFGWKVIQVEGAEGDDIMAIMSRWALENITVQDGLFEINQPCLIIASDNDMQQIRHRDIKQWSPHQKKFIEKTDPDFLIEKIIRGDAGDGVPSVLCPDDWFVNSEFEGIRAKPITKKIIEKFKSGLGLTKEEKDRYLRNKTMIDFACIPPNLAQEIINTYKVTPVNRDLNTIFLFLAKVKAKQLTDRVQEFKTW